MNKMLRPTGLKLVGVIFICLCFVLNAQAGGMQANLLDLQEELSQFRSASLDQYQGSSIGQLRIAGDTITFPWAARPGMQAHLPEREEIAMNGAHSAHEVSDLKAINSIKQRDIIYDETQNGDPESQGLANSLDISVTGQEQAKDGWAGADIREDNIERIVDDALNKGMKHRENDSRSAWSQQLGNNMVIDVSGISVSAINTVKGGNAVATSNIIIKPVQIIVCPSEVEEKLK